MKIQIVPKEYITKLNYHDALLYCSMMNIDGKDDWKLPTVGECRHISGLVKRNMIGLVKTNRVITSCCIWVNYSANGGINGVYDVLANSLHDINVNEHREFYVCPIRYEI